MKPTKTNPKNELARLQAQLRAEENHNERLFREELKLSGLRILIEHGRAQLDEKQRFIESIESEVKEIEQRLKTSAPRKNDKLTRAKIEDLKNKL